jgi:hypothetical protein
MVHGEENQVRVTRIADKGDGGCQEQTSSILLGENLLSEDLLQIITIEVITRDLESFRKDIV